MLSVVIFCGSEKPAALARTVAALVPAIPEGMVRDGWIVHREPSREIEAIADAAGCTLCMDDAERVLGDIAGKLAGEWVLLLASGVVLEDGWWRDAACAVDHLSPGGAANGRIAAFSNADPRIGLKFRIREWLGDMAVIFPGFPASGQAIIAPVSQLRANPGRFSRLPVRLGAADLRLRARAYLSPVENRSEPAPD